MQWSKMYEYDAALNKRCDDKVPKAFFSDLTEPPAKAAWLTKVQLSVMYSSNIKAI